MTLVLTTGEGTVTVPGGVLVDIAARAAQAVPGVRVKRRRTIDLEARLVRLALAAPRGEPLLEVARQAQGEAARALEAMCGLETQVDVHVGELR